MCIFFVILLWNDYETITFLHLNKTSEGPGQTLGVCRKNQTSSPKRRITGDFAARATYRLPALPPAAAGSYITMMREIIRNKWMNESAAQGRVIGSWIRSGRQNLWWNKWRTCYTDRVTVHMVSFVVYIIFLSMWTRFHYLQFLLIHAS